jgi:SAM-dependent methyltransferase
MDRLKQRLRYVWRYLRGRTPWDSGIVPPEVIAWIESREARQEPPGNALDLGCGTGTTSLFLAAHGWQVIGVDFVPQAIRRARRKARRQHVKGSATFHVGDVTRFTFLEPGATFDLVVDIGCLHSLLPDQQGKYADHLTPRLRPGATFLLYAFMPRLSEGGQRRGIDRAVLTALFEPDFEIVDIIGGEDTADPRPSAWYTLRRKDNTS